MRRVCLMRFYASLSVGALFWGIPYGFCGSTQLSQPGTFYRLTSVSIGDLTISSRNVILDAAGFSVTGSILLQNAPGAIITNVNGAREIVVDALSTGAVITNSNVGAITVNGATSVSIIGSVVNGPVALTAQNVDIIGTQAASLWLHGLAVPLGTVNIKYNRIVSGDLKLVHIVGTESDAGCPTTAIAIEYNYVESTRDTTSFGAQCDSTSPSYNKTVYAAECDEPLALTLRCAVGGLNGVKNTIVGNTIIARGDATGLYIRDSVNNTLIQRNFIQVNGSGSGGSGRGWGAMAFASGKNTPAEPMSRNDTIEDNIFHAKDIRALYLQGYLGGHIFRRNVVYSENDYAWFAGGDRGDPNLFDHNTIVSGGGSGMSWNFGITTTPDQHFTNNIVSVSGASKVFAIDHWLSAGYTGNNNLFYNSSGKSIQFGNLAASLADWQGLGKDAGSIVGDPKLKDIATLDFHLTDATSAAHGAASDGTDAGAFQLSDICTASAQPALSKACGAADPTPPDASWHCSDWYACNGSQQERICPGVAPCGTATVVPPVAAPVPVSGGGCMASGSGLGFLGLMIFVATLTTGRSFVRRS